MTPLGRSAAAGALLTAVATIATWNVGTSRGDAAAAVPAEGSALFRARGCATCHHGPETASRLGDSFPSLADAPSWAGTRRPGLTAEDYLAESIAAPGAFISPAFGGVGPGTAMPQLALTAEEIDAIVEYLLTSNSNGSR